MAATVRESERLPLSNEELAQRLSEVADLLDAQHANPFRVGAYRAAAHTVRGLSEPVTEILAREGRDGLQKLPGIGRTLSQTLERLTQTGRLPLLEQLRGETRQERVLMTVAGIGPKTASRIHAELGIESLADLEAAAYDGRLAALSGMGQKKIRAVRESLAGRFRQRAKFPEPALPFTDEPSVAELLDIDEEYRRKAGADRLLRVIPRRFNPTGEAWLPILHTHRGDRHYTVLFSNSARAQELGTTHDWVVISRDGRRGAGSWTVITSLFGPCKGRRIVRGREKECRRHYQAQSPEAN
jgi:predicted flap endonuclease-1-like 5' DNA nuclease